MTQFSSDAPWDGFRSEVEAFLDRTGMAPARFGELAMNDPNFVLDLKGGEREFKRSTIEKVQKWISGFDAGSAYMTKNRGNAGRACGSSVPGNAG